MSNYEVTKRDNSTHGHGEWSVRELMGNAHFSQWVEVFQGSYERCVAYVAAVRS